MFLYAARTNTSCCSTKPLVMCHLIIPSRGDKKTSTSAGHQIFSTGGSAALLGHCSTHQQHMKRIAVPVSAVWVLPLNSWFASLTSPAPIVPILMCILTESKLTAPLTLSVRSRHHLCSHNTQILPSKTEECQHFCITPLEQKIVGDWDEEMPPHSTTTPCSSRSDIQDNILRAPRISSWVTA